MPGVTIGQAVDFSKSRPRRCRRGSATTTCRCAAIRTRRQPAGRHLRVPLIVIFWVGGAIREPARPAGDPRQRALSICGALLPLFIINGNFMGSRSRARRSTSTPRSAHHADRTHQQARYPDGRVRQPASTRRGARPARRDRARRAGAAAPNPVDDGGDGRRAGAAGDGDRRRCVEPFLDRARGGGRDVDRHAVHAVRAAGGLHRAREGPRRRGHSVRARSWLRFPEPRHRSRRRRALGCRGAASAAPRPRPGQAPKPPPTRLPDAERKGQPQPPAKPMPQ